MRRLIVSLIVLMSAQYLYAGEALQLLAEGRQLSSAPAPDVSGISAAKAEPAAAAAIKVSGDLAEFLHGLGGAPDMLSHYDFVTAQAVCLYDAATTDPRLLSCAFGSDSPVQHSPMEGRLSALLQENFLHQPSPDGRAVISAVFSCERTKDDLGSFKYVCEFPKH